MKILHVRIPEEVKIISETLENNGFDAYLVGGCVRDIMRDAEPKDWDLTTNAHPDDITRLFPEHYANNDYGTIGIKTGSEDSRLEIVEVTPYRSESGYSDRRRPDNVTFGVSLEEDLARRDFTVNALAYNLRAEKIVDLYGGIDDLKEKRLRTVGEADARFNEDALRMMRAVRLATELGYVIDGETMAAIAKNAHLLKEIAIERIATEFVRIID